MDFILSPHEDNNLSRPETPFLDRRVKKSTKKAAKIA
jgi:hypothetical protein